MHKILDKCINALNNNIKSANMYQKRKGYTYAVKHPEYTYPYARKIFNELQKQIYKYDDLDNIGSLLNEFCISFNCLKEEISFDELLERAIHHPPLLSKSND